MRSFPQRRSAVLLSVLLLAACVPTAVKADIGDQLLDTAPTLTDLARRSEVIVVGRIVRETHEWNMARGADPAVESATKIILAQTYLVAVETPLKGVSAKEITIAVPKARGLKGYPLRPEERWSPPAIGQRYVLFLLQNPGTSVYGLPAEPSRFRLGTDAVVESRWPDAARYYPARPSQLFIQDVVEAARTN